MSIYNLSIYKKNARQLCFVFFLKVSLPSASKDAKLKINGINHLLSVYCISLVTATVVTISIKVFTCPQRKQDFSLQFPTAQYNCHIS